MNFAIIADDLTGANDSGVQLAKFDLRTSVLLEMNAEALKEQDAIVLNTDSRSCSSNEAYERVKTASEFIKILSPEVVYKKIDSTLRGNIGAEIDAMYDIFQPDFVIVAPAYPKNGRRIVNGFHYLNDQLLHETEVAVDPKTPVTESFVPKLLGMQTKRTVELVTCGELRSGAEGIAAKLDVLHKSEIPYIVFDSEREQDLQIIVETITTLNYRIVWVGSAGLVEHLSPKFQLDNRAITPSNHESHVVLVVVGSVSGRTRRQLQELLGREDVEGVALQSDQIVTDNGAREREISRVCLLASQVLSRNKHLALYSTASEEDMLRTKQAGIAQSLEVSAISDMISAALGETVDRLLEQFDLSGIVMTGGDTAVQVCQQLGAERLELIGEVETGVPIGRLKGPKELYVVTKAGSFGTDGVLIRSVDMLKGESYS
ncbi:four-carbon acid sugar kinase family protein [Paenibacillus frigoriresistens]|uniref:four-carbon acid sugar kinase family protein n=1 Tax=Paenibacillus alginolyticus TaxID=59839 RepID=UPI001563344E|nr:four-carbon acid sugar kinase family protein [Paenibacillus frigoriresistens]NRF93729.1 four-carbon acid sugar kinase family protein [Paenibacillus frigoriresistens]